MNRGEVWWVDFDPSRGGEIQKVRPSLIISNDASNKFLNRVQVVPLTSQTNKLYPSEAYVEVDGKRSKAMTDQLTTVSKRRLKNKFGRVSESDLKSIERVIKVQLGL